jgi:hypothetical protein
MSSLAARVATAALGCWLMAAPDWQGLGSLDAAAWIAGPLLVAIAIVAASEVTRSVRWAGVPVGVALALAAVIAHPSGPATLTVLAAGAAAAGLSVPGRTSMSRFGGGWAALRSD